MLALTLLSAPGAHAQWTKLAQAGGNYISFAQGMAFRNGKLWFGRDQLYLSLDTGKTWTVQNTFPPNNLITDIDFSDGDHGIVSTWSGVYLTSDGGQHWITIPGAGTSISAVLLDSVNAGMFASYGGFAARATAATTWQSSTKNGGYFCVRTNHDRDKCYYMAAAQSGGTNAREVWHTTDRGKSWVNPGATFEFDSYSMAVDSCNDSLLYALHENFYMRNGPDCHVLQSRDMGASWQYVLTQPLSLLTGSIVTSTQGIYAQTVSMGLIRSTNKGATWKFVGGPCGAADTRTMTVVNDTTIIASDSLGNVWKFSDAAAIAGVRIPSPTVSPDTVRVNICDSANFNLAISTLSAPCHAYVLDTVYFTSADSVSILTFFKQFSSTDSNFTLQGTVLPLGTGIFKGLLHVRQRFGGLDYDRTAPVTFIVSPGQPKHTVSPPVLSLGTLPLCPGAFIDDTVTLRNAGCDGLELLGAFLLGDTTVFHATATPRRLASGDSARIAIRYQPSRASSDSVLLIVQTNNGNDTIPIAARARQTHVGLALESDTIVSTACDTTHQFITVVNPGCNPLILDSASIDTGSPFAFAGAIAFPTTLSELQSTNIAMGLTTHGPGTASGLLHFHYHVIGATDTAAYDTAIALAGIIKAGPAHFTISDSSLAFGNLPLCTTSSGLLTIFNDGCDTLRFLSFMQGGDSIAFALASVRPQNLPPGDSEVLRFACSLDSLRNYLASLQLATNSGSIHIALAATGVPDMPRITLIPPVIGFHNAVANCGHDTSSVVFTNSGCAWIRVDSVRTQPFGVFSPIQAAIPITLTKDSSVSIPFSFSPDAADITTGGAMIAYSDANGREHDTTILLSGIGLPHAAFQANIGVPSPPRAGVFDSVAIPVSLTISQKANAPKSGTLLMEFKIVLNTDVLSPFRVDLVDPTMGPLQWSVTADTLTIDVTIDLAQFLRIAKEDSYVVAFRVMARPFVSDFLATDIALASVSSTSSATACIDDAPPSSTSRFTLSLACGDSIMSGFMGTHSLLITSLNPNPATGTVKVEYALGDGLSSDTSNADPSVAWYVFDAQGSLVIEGVAHTSPLVLSIGSLASGEFFLYLNREHTAARDQVWRAFVVQH